MAWNGFPAKRYSWLVLMVLIAAAIYGWTLWYYGGLYRAGALLTASGVTPETLPRTLSQELIAALPEILFAGIAWIALGRKRFVREMGLRVRSEKKLALPLAAGGCLLALVLALLFAGLAPLAACYLWGYYLLLIAFMEELIFRGLLPFLAEKGGAPAWAVWVVPGVLFACMHTLMPMVRSGFTAGGLALSLLSVLGGYTAGHCGFYALRRWSGTLWLPVLVHGLLDFCGIFI